uniref:CUB domain protein n=1 Tax=Heterorhabditis bacteriophora TaxID=37862 RepID=A0A1I7X9P4_HETBA
MSGVIHSPNWPNDYKNDEECIWDIQVPLGYHVQIKFTHFDIEPSEQCINDALIISQEHSSRAFAPIGDYYFLFQDEEAHPPMCGIVVPKDIRSEKCGTVFRLSHGVISSPHYPEFYPNNNSKCEYLIDPVNANQNTVIILKLIDFDLSEIKYDYSRSPCTGDNIEIKDVTNNRVVVVYCGECGGQVELSAEHGYMDSISSPAFPLDYAHDLDCIWNVSAPKERIISIKYEALDLEASADCSLDFLEVFDGDIISNKTSMGKLCGDNSRMPQGRIFTKSNRILIHFVSDRSMSKGGPQSGCGGMLTAKADWQTLKPPLNDDGQYVHNLHCGWNIIGAEKTMLELKILKIDTEELQQLPGASAASRCVDAITIYDGYKSFSPVLATDICEDPTITYPLKH